MFLHCFNSLHHKSRDPYMEHGKYNMDEGEDSLE